MSKHAFISYAHADAEGLIRLQIALKNLERQGQISTWTDRAILAGQRWDAAIRDELEKAALILFLVSPNLIASDYVHDVELKRALKRHQAGDAIVVPIIYRACDWSHTELRGFQALPTDGQPIKTSSQEDIAWQDVTDGLRKQLAATS